MRNPLLLVAFLFSSTINAQKRPNIVFVLSDDHAYQAISSYGFGLNHTPNIDKLAQEGMLFTNAFVDNSLCAPSRASFITGKYSHINGIQGNRDLVFDGSQVTFPKLLHNAGYQTAIIGKWHLISDPTGFDYWNVLPGQGDYYNPDFINNGVKGRVEGYVTDLTMDFALNWLNTRDTSRPFCVLIWNKAPHRQWMPPLKYLHEFDNKNIPVPSTYFDDYSTRTRAAHEQKMRIDQWLSPNYDLKENFNVEEPYQRLDKYWKAIFDRLTPDEQKEFEDAYTPKNDAFRRSNLKGKQLAIWKYERFIKDYLSCIQSVDDNVGRLNAYLKQNGLDKNTIVIYSSDQGFYLGEHGWFDKRFMYEQSFKTPLIIRWPGVVKPGSVNKDLVMNLDISETLLDAAKVNIPSAMQGESILPLLKGEHPASWRKAVYYHYYDSGGEHNVAKHVGVRTDRYKLIWFYENKEWELYDLLKDKNELHNVYNEPNYKQIQNKLKEELHQMEVKYKDTEMIGKN
ncbi:sulfatase [Ginsengibacter hankyongi]|uniref:Sulfatase n=1 Tax=Ginsengibacter hankyongi TaxID=2607284 RepID=A0A5J5IBC2_9BACT|nr:sulfatase [Ginsengibacter hankyongi]KAA9036079.1 sulfatase [Ginsengibacter hankyongi]